MGGISLTFNIIITNDSYFFLLLQWQDFNRNNALLCNHCHLETKQTPLRGREEKKKSSPTNKEGYTEKKKSSPTKKENLKKNNDVNGDQK